DFYPFRIITVTFIRAFFIEFFSSWCGACVSYAPTYKKLANELKSWSSIVQIAAVDCADEKNLNLCREHQVDSFPSLRYFKYSSKNAKDAVLFVGDKYDLNKLPLEIAEFVKNDWSNQRPENWPTFDPVNHNIQFEEIWLSLPISVTHLLLAVENEPARTSWAVQLMDIMTALRHMLMIEIPRKAIIDNENLVALKSWIYTMKKYLPGTIGMRRLLFRLNSWINKISNEVTAEQWLQKINDLQGQLGQPLPSNTSYLACRGSAKHFRGFSCGIWTIIHAMSVQAYAIEKDNALFNANTDLIEPFHQFIWRFFSCAECARHFHEGVLKRNMSYVFSEDGVMWFWMTHNIVNKFIAKTGTEDPLFPKQQFPPKIICMECQNPAGFFDELAVFHFMLRYYSSVKTDSLRLVVNYKVNDFENGKLANMEVKHLSPDIPVGAFNVDAAEVAAEIHEMNQKHKWNQVGSGNYGGSSMKQSFSVLWLSMIAVVVLFVYMKYRQNRSKIWKTFYYNDYKL
ncbi:unnamed protein product, partial [Thelazia callipaeda]|uniref:Sulfhydryl oxidase n=1 Tax=Thelazia callipaeda TaxID=103827 RepID=A0A158RB37_THECL